MNRPLLSIIIPVHNYNNQLNKCLDSIQHQSLENIEVIIVDDYSTESIDKYLAIYLCDSRFHLIRLEENKGPGGARNAGINIAKGEFIGFCDSDDWVDLTFYESACNALIATGADIAMCGQIREYECAQNDPIYKCMYDRQLILDGNMAFQIMTYNYNMGIKVIPPCTNKVYCSDFFHRLGFGFEEKVYFQDTIFSLKSVLNAQKIVCVPTVLYHHYRRPNSIIQSFSQKHIDDFENLGLSIRCYLKEQGLYEQYINNYYNLLSHFYGIIIREIFEFLPDDNARKRYMIESFSTLKKLFIPSEYIEYVTAEQLRKHILPDMKDTTLY